MGTLSIRTDDVGFNKASDRFHDQPAGVGFSFTFFGVIAAAIMI
jgi:hypothetical protein